MKSLVVGALLGALMLMSVGPAAAGGRLPSAEPNPYAKPAGAAEAPAAFAALAAEYVDPAGDAGNAMDVTTVRVSNDFLGKLTFDLTIVGQATVHPSDRLFVVIDSDGNPATGDPLRAGAEFFIDYDGDGFSGGPSHALSRWTGSWNPVATTTLNSIAQPASPGSLTLRLTINRSELGNTTGFNFYIAAVYPDGAPTSTEFAPNSPGTWAYDDTVRPTALARWSKPSGAARNQLAWTHGDDSGGARVTIRVLRNGSSRPTKTLTFAPRGSGQYTTMWPVPKGIRGYHRFCVQATDSFGNATGATASCKPVKFKRIKARVNVLRASSGGGQRWLAMWIENVPRGALVTIDCVRGCSLHERGTARTGYRSSKFSGRFLPVGARIVVRVTMPRWIGFHETITLGSGTTLTRIVKCLAPGTRTAGRCP